MNQNNKKMIWLYTAYALILIFIFYLFLVCSDYLLGKWISKKNEQEVTQAELIERARITSEDNPQRDEAIKKGYKPLFYPETIDNYRPLKELSRDIGGAPLAPQPYSNLYFCNEGYGLIKYRSDRFGFRNDDKLWDQKIDILLIGDSFTHGACVKEADSISGSLLETFKVLNLGTYGNHAIHYAAIEKTFIPVVKPRIAITIFYANDNEDDSDSIIWDRYFKENFHYLEFADNKYELSSKITDFYSKAEYLIEHLLNGKESPDEFIKFHAPAGFAEKLKKYLYIPTIRKIIDNYMKLEGLKDTLPSSNILAIDTLKASCEQFGCKPMIAYIPNSNFWRPDPRSSNYLKLLRNYCQSKDILFVDLSTSVQSLGEQAYAPKGPHLSPAGYQASSKTLLQHIEQIIK